MDEFVLLGRLLRSAALVAAAGMDRVFRLAGCIKFNSKPAVKDFAGATGVPATNPMRAWEPQPLAPSVVQHEEPMSAPAPDSSAQNAFAPPPHNPASASTGFEAGSGSAQPEHSEEGDQRQEDDLDWAGSLPHAAVASLHIGSVLTLIRAGWLVADELRLAEVSSLLDAMEAFQDRTANAIAPVLDAMTDEQHADFFSDFGADFPPELPGLDDVP